MNWLIGVDVGGTFTDLYAVDSDSGHAVIHKTPSTPDDPARAISAGLAALGGRYGVPVEAMARFAHGTTVATNALIQRRGGPTALITTRGFRDLLEIGRQIRPKIYDLLYGKSQVLGGSTRPRRRHRHQPVQRRADNGGRRRPPVHPHRPCPAPPPGWWGPPRRRGCRGGAISLPWIWAAPPPMCA